MFKWGGELLSVIRGLGIYFDKMGVMILVVFIYFVSKFVVVFEVVVFFYFYLVEILIVFFEERYYVLKFGILLGCYWLVIKYGFMDEVISFDLFVLIYN